MLTVRLSPKGDGMAIQTPAGTEIILRNEAEAGSIIMRMLFAQTADSTCRGKDCIGTEASPTQHMIEEWLKKPGNTIKKIERKPPAASFGGLDVSLKDLGLL